MIGRRTVRERIVEIAAGRTGREKAEITGIAEIAEIAEITEIAEIIAEKVEGRVRTQRAR